MLIVKLFGISLIAISCTLIGFLKSHLLLERCKKLSQIYDGTNTLYEYVEKGGCELVTAVKNAFCNAAFLNFENGILSYNDGSLTVEDKKLIDAFFGSLGSSVKKIECDKINNFKFKLDAHIKEANLACSQKAKIYQTFGICLGLALAVLLI